MKTESTLDQKSMPAGEVDSGGCAPMPGCLALAEMTALESSIQHNDHEIARVQDQLAAMHRKQAARRQELGYQKARMGMKLSRVSDTPIEGARMVTVQTDAGIATRWIRPDNAGGMARELAAQDSESPTKQNG